LPLEGKHHVQTHCHMSFAELVAADLKLWAEAVAIAGVKLQ
jgi:hypothetical protein